MESIVSSIEAVYPNKSVVPFEIRGVRVFTMDLEAGAMQKLTKDWRTMSDKCPNHYA